MDSYLYSESTSSLKGAVDGAGRRFLLAGASTLASGELMMTSHGRMRQNSTANSSEYLRGDAISAQYIYSAPAMTQVCSTTAATAATASILASIFQGQGNATAVGGLVLGASAAGDTLAGASVTIEIDDLTQTKTFEFKAGSNVNVFDSGVNKYEVGVQNADGSWFTKEEARNQLYNAIDASRSDSSALNIAAPAKSGTDTITLTAGTAGTAWNTEPIASSDTGVTGVAVSSWSGGTDYSLNSLTLILEDVAHGTVSYVFDQATATGASTATVIGCQDATDTDKVAQAIGQTIALSQAAGAINISVASIASNQVNLVADTAGTSMNGKVIAGTFISGPYGTMSAMAGGTAAVTTCPYFVYPASPGGAYSRPAWVANTARRVIEGPNRGDLLESRAPFYKLL
jgi:hypothetical protein